MPITLENVWKTYSEGRTVEVGVVAHRRQEHAGCPSRDSNWIVVGYYPSKAALSTFSSDLFTFDLRVRTSTLVFASLAVIIVALPSQGPGLRAVRRLNIPKIVK